MRFLHTADLHLGMEPDKGRSWSKMRGRELWDAFHGMIEACGEGAIDLLLIAGDLFHRQPLVRELKEAAAGFASIPATKVVIIAGNHDYISGTSGYRNFKWPDNVTFLMSDKPKSVYFEDLNTEVYGLSYHVRNIYEPVYDGIKPADPSRINILLGHGGEPSNVPIDWNSLERAGFDYVAMGHLHKPVDISENIRYAGSPEPLDKNETGPHGYIVGETEENAENKTDTHDRIAGENSKWEKTSNVAKANKDTNKLHRIHTERVFCAKRSYIKADIEVTCEDTYGTLRRKVMELIRDRNFYVLRLYGEYDPDIHFDLEGLDDLGSIVEVIDETEPKLDIDRIAAENSGNVIGMFIDRLSHQFESSDELSNDCIGEIHTDATDRYSLRSHHGGQDNTDPAEENEADNSENAGARTVRERALYYGIMALMGRL